MSNTLMDDYPVVCQKETEATIDMPDESGMQGLAVDPATNILVQAATPDHTTPH